MICELSCCFSRIYSVNDDNLTFVVKPSFFSFAVDLGNIPVLYRNDDVLFTPVSILS